MLKLKKTISMLLAALMISSLALTAVFTASAKDFDDVKNDNPYGAQIDMLSDIGVIVGTSETEFSPEQNVTREQMALLLYRLMTGKDNSGTVNTSPFTDLSNPTFYGAISWAAANGYILGTSATTFNPAGGISLQDAIAMITRALGQTNDKTAAGYPWSYIDISNRLGLTEELKDVAYGDTLTRGETAALLHAAITADYIIMRTVSGSTVPLVTTVLRYVYGYESGTAVITATNNFALPGTASVIRNGYAEISIIDDEGNTDAAFVKVSDLGISDNADNHLGESFSVFYNKNDKTGIASVLGAADESSETTASSFKVGADNAYIQVGGVRYNVVSAYSGSTATNANELLVFVYDEDGTLTKLDTNEAVAEKNGFFSLKMISDDGSEIADRAILMPLTHAELDINSAGEINIAGGAKADELTGGLVNTGDAKDGDRVLYYFNPAVKRLVIAEVLTTEKNVKVSRLSEKEAVIGGKTYTLGVEGTDFDAAAVYAKLSVGESFDIVLRGNTVIDAGDPTIGENTYDSTYLIATSEATPVVHNDKVCYFITANIGGKSVNAYVTNSEVTKNHIYRYESAGDGILKLIGADDDKFAQKNELKTVIDSALSLTIEKNGNVYYTLSGNGASDKFITTEDTVIVVKTASGFVYKTGAYASALTVNDGARVVAIMKDSVGSVETLKYLYISDGALGSALDTASFAKVLQNVALELVDGVNMTVYTVYNFAGGKVENLYSEHADLSEGEIYLLSEHGHLTDSVKSLDEGEVTGYAGNTITIDSTTYKLSDGVIISELDLSAEGVHSAKTLKASEVYGKNVSFVANDNVITRILVID